MGLPVQLRRLPVRLTLLPLLAAAFPTLAADTPEHVLPMWMQGGHPTVALSLDGRAEPLRFVVDSAAGATLVDGRVVRRYGLVDGKAEVSIAQGATGSCRPAHCRPIWRR
ncbi:hypothetical protein G6F58_013210 [Rhizopus delemar]|nr:hypothetical protein G6F58_013210 [Rhizopus delemar]